MINKVCFGLVWFVSVWSVRCVTHHGSCVTRHAMQEERSVSLGEIGLSMALKIQKIFSGIDEKSDIFFKINLTGYDGGTMIVCTLTVQNKFKINSNPCKTDAKKHPPGALRMGAFFTVIWLRFSPISAYSTFVSPWLCPFKGSANQSNKNCSSSSATGRWNRPRSLRIPRL